MRVAARRLLGTINPPEEPALTTGVSVSAVAGIIAIVTSLFPSLTNNTAVTVGVIVCAFLLPIVTSVLVRGKVWSPASVKEILKEGVDNAEKAAEEIGRLKTYPVKDNTVPMKD